MAFEHSVCWDVETVSQVMNTEALQPDEAVFLATHHPVRMFRRSPMAAGAGEAYSQEQFLQEFLNIGSFAFVPILG